MKTKEPLKTSPALESTEEADQALFAGTIQGLVAAVRSDERPLMGLAGLLDWRFQGAISRCLKTGFVTGHAGECTYLPVTRNGSTYHLILVGVGNGAGAGASESKGALPPETLPLLKKNLTSLKLSRVGLSRSDLGLGSASGEDFLNKNFKGIPLCIVK